MQRWGQEWLLNDRNNRAIPDNFAEVERWLLRLMLKDIWIPIWAAAVILPIVISRFRNPGYLVAFTLALYWKLENN